MNNDSLKLPHVRNCPKGYEELAQVLMEALCQAAYGKGKERHGSDNPILHQPIITTPLTQGSPDGLTYQVSKKAIESGRLPAERGDAELMGAVNYAACAIIVRRRLRKQG